MLGRLLGAKSILETFYFITESLKLSRPFFPCVNLAQNAVHLPVQLAFLTRKLLDNVLLLTD